VRGVHHLAIQVRDLAAVERFYKETLGLRELRRWPAKDGAPGERSVWLDAGDGAFLALERVPEGATADEDPGRAEGAAEGGGGGRVGSPSRSAERGEAERPGLHLVALRIERAARAGWERRLAAAGVAVYARTAFTLYVRDPEGNRVGLSHWPEAES
jgi:catechol 2,3-dioxygenase-like lactoylglutathione lyase family enzyme